MSKDSMEIKTIKDVADKLGYSVGTISRAINHKKGVSEKNREKILAAMEEMGYHPNRIAQSLVKQQSFLVGLIVPDLTNSFLLSIVTAIEETLELHGYHMLVFDSHWDAEKEQEKIRIAQANQVDGLLIKPAFSDINFMKSVHVPCVLVSQEFSDTYNWVDVDNFYAAYQATEHLILSGCKKIAFINGSPDNLILRKRKMGYKAALSDYQLPIHQEYITTSQHTIQTGYKAASRILSLPDPPDAIFCSDDLHALGALSCAQDLGIRIPDELSIIGFNNSETAQLPQVRLTSVAQPAYQIGQMAAQMLLNQIEYKGEDVWHPQKILLTPHLEVRATTRPVDPTIKRKLRPEDF